MIPPSPVEIALAHLCTCSTRVPQPAGLRRGNVEEVTDSPHGAPTAQPTTDARPEPLDLAAIERELAAVEAALPRLDDGTYWLDEVTGDEIPDAVLADDPVARRA